VKLNIRRAAVSVLAATSLALALPGLSAAQPGVDNVAIPPSQSGLMKGELMATQGAPPSGPASIAVQQASDNDNDGTSNTPAPDHEQFLRAAITGHATEIEAAKLAQTRSSNPEVRQLGAQLERDHQAGIQDAVRVAQDVDVSAPQAPTTNEQRELISDLGTLSGSNFDRAFIRATIVDHQADVAAYEGAVRDQPSEVAELAERQLPVLRNHLSMTETTAAHAGVDISGL